MGTEAAFPLETVLRWASNISGKGIKSDRDKLIDLVRESLEALFNEETVENLRRWTIFSSGSFITAPKELAEPLKYKIGHKVGPIRDKAYEFLGYARNDSTGYQTNFSYVGEYATYFDLPIQGGRVAARSLDYFDYTKYDSSNLACKTTCSKDEPPYLLVQGTDINDKVVYSPHDGTLDVGERIYITPPDQAPTYSRTIFKKISSVRVVNAQLNIQLVWCNTHYFGATPYEFGLLANYDPGDSFPTFRRYSFPLHDTSCCYALEVLGQLKQPALVYDNELIRGFDSGAIQNMIRANDLKSKNDIGGAQFNSGLAMTSIRKKNERLAPNTDAIPVHVPTSAGGFKNVY